MKQKYQSFFFAIGGGLLILAAIMIAAFAVAAAEHAKASERLNITYQRALYDVKDNLNNIEINLSKMLAGGKKLNIEIAGDVSRQSRSASDSLKNLPMDYHSIEEANKFLNQVGDFCVSYSRALVNGAETSVYEDKLERLYDAAHELNLSFDKISESIGEGDNIVATLNRTELDGITGLGDDELINNPVEYPELIYDGPFSDTAAKKNFKLLDDLPKVDCAEAVEKLKGYIEGRLVGVDCVGESSEPEAYTLCGEFNGNRFYASVSKRGGKLISFNTDKTVGGVKITEQKAVETALGYAQKAGFSELKEVWYNSVEGVAVINFAPFREGIIYYTDLVKVKVSLTDASLLGIEAIGYCTNHCERTPEVVIGENTAKAVLPEEFTLLDIRPAVIPLNMKEVTTYELGCVYKGLYYFIYVDAKSGETVNIMRVVDNDQGKLVL